jgi:hypothetical protein
LEMSGPLAQGIARRHFLILSNFTRIRLALR